MLTKERLEKLDNSKLIDIVKNYKQYGYETETRELTISILENRGISEQELKLSGNFTNANFEFASKLYESFTKSSFIAFVFYGLRLVLIILMVLFNIQTEGYIGIVDGFNILLGIGFLFFLIKSLIYQNNFYTAVGDNYGVGGALIYLFLGMPFYIFMYFFFRKQMKEKMNSVT